MTFDSLTKTSEFRLKLYPRHYTSCVRFYRDVLGFPIIKKWDRGRNDRGSMFDTGTGIIELLKEGPGIKPRGCDISIHVKDVAKLYSRLRNKAPVVFALRDNPWGDTSFCIKDPDGFEITFFTQIKMRS